MDELRRFEEAQEGSMGYETALEEMKNGRKRSHWMWYIFPQIKGLGQSYDSKYYGISSLYEARQYMEHDLLGRRLREITHEVLNHYENGIYYVMDSDIDVLKFRSCMTLFDIVSPYECFKEALDTFFDGEKDEKTLALIQTERDYLYADSAFRRHRVGPYDDKGFFESGSYESREIPNGKVLPTLVDLFLKGERVKDMLHHYLYHKDFSSYRVSGVESTLRHYCLQILIGIHDLADEQQKRVLIKLFKGWQDRITDVESSAETFDWILTLMKKNVSPLLEEYAKDSLIIDQILNGYNR